MNQSISEQIKKEAEARYGKLFNAAPTAFWRCNELIKHCMDSFAAGASFRESLGGKEGGAISENDMTVHEFYSGFNLDFMTDEEKQTIYTATELYAKGKLRQASQPSTAKWSDSDVKQFLEDYRVANREIYLNPVIWFDKLNKKK